MIKEVNVKIETDVVEIATLLVKIVDVAKNKGNVAELLPSLIAAIEGVSSIPASWEQDKGVVVGSFMMEISKVIDVLVVK
jgi:hypothetical protein